MSARLGVNRSSFQASIRIDDAIRPPELEHLVDDAIAAVGRGHADGLAYGGTAMPKSHRPNERIKRTYLDFLPHSPGRGEAKLKFAS